MKAAFGPGGSGAKLDAFLQFFIRSTVKVRHMQTIIVEKSISAITIVHEESPFVDLGALNLRLMRKRVHKPRLIINHVGTELKIPSTGLKLRGLRLTCTTPGVL